MKGLPGEHPPAPRPPQSTEPAALTKGNADHRIKPVSRHPKIELTEVASPILAEVIFKLEKCFVSIQLYKFLNKPPIIGNSLMTLRKRDRRRIREQQSGGLDPPRCRQQCATPRLDQAATHPELANAHSVLQVFH